MSLLSVIQDACARMALVQPTFIVGNSDRQTQQMYSLVNQAGRELARDKDAGWQAMVEEGSFTTVAQNQQTAAIPSDLDYFVEDSFFNRTTMRQVLGPVSSQEWQALQAFPALASVYLMYRERDGDFLIIPAPPAGQSIYFEYVSINWVQPLAGSNTSTYQNDTDVALIDETLICDSLVWRFRKAKGLDYAEDMTTFERNKEKAIGRDGSRGALTMSSRSNLTWPLGWR